MCDYIYILYNYTLHILSAKRSFAKVRELEEMQQHRKNVQTNMCWTDRFPVHLLLVVSDRVTWGKTALCGKTAPHHTRKI